MLIKYHFPVAFRWSLQKLHWKLVARISGFLVFKSSRHCPKSPLAQLNHCLVHLVWSKELIDSWISPKPSVLLTISPNAVLISLSSDEVKIRIMLAIGQACPRPAWGPPTLLLVNFLIVQEGNAALRINNGTSHEVWIAFTQNEVSRVLVDGIANIEVAKERGTQKTRNVCIIHAVCYKVSELCWPCRAEH
jgi:hypothetical protein